MIVVFCNRSGTEDDVFYAGTSAVVGIKDGEVSVYGILGRGVKELLFVDTGSPPIAKLVQRADTKAAGPIPYTEPGHASPITGNRGVGPFGGRSTPSQKGHEQEHESSQSTNPNASSRPPAMPSAGQGRKGTVPPNVAIPDASSFYRPASFGASDVILDESPTLSTPTAPSPTPHGLRPKVVSPGSRSLRDNLPTPSPRRLFPKPDTVASKRGSARGGHMPIDNEQITPISPSEGSEPSPSLFYWTPYKHDNEQPNGESPTSHPRGATSNPDALARNNQESPATSLRPRDESLTRRKPGPSPHPERHTWRPGSATNDAGVDPLSVVGKREVPKSRDASRSRLGRPSNRTEPDRMANTSQSSIPIVASPSVFRPDPNGVPQRPSSRLDHRYSRGVTLSRSSSRARGWSGSQHAFDSSGANSPFAGGARQMEDSSGRGVSRSRTEGWPMASGTPSETPDRTQSRAMSRGRQPGDSIQPPDRSGSSAAQEFRSSSRPATQDDEIMAVVEFGVSGCHVFGLGSFPDDITPEELVTEVTSSPLCQTAIPYASLATLAEATDSCPTMSGRSVQTLATPKGSPATPSPFFDPKTPKAMTFADCNPDALTGPAAAPAPDLGSIEASLLMVQGRIASVALDGRPKSAVW